MQWFQAISANMNAEAQRRALAASRNTASLVFADVGDDEDSSAVAEAALAQGDVRRVKYSAEMAEIGFPAQSRDQRDSPKEGQQRLDTLKLARGQSDFRLPPPKRSQSQSQDRNGDQRRDDAERKDVEPEGERKTRTAESNNQAGHHPRKVIPYKEYAAC